MRCAVRCCQEPAVTIYRGYALCDRCDEICDEIPDWVPATLLERLIADVISGDNDLADQLRRLNDFWKR